MMELTRCYAFPAAHVLVHSSFSAEENERIYGKCANPHGHGHNYDVEVTITGPLDEQTGQIFPLGLLDQVFDEFVGSRFGSRLLNEDPAFQDLVPTAENIAVVIHATLATEVASRGPAEVIRVKVVETRNNSCISGAMT
jgi:6-pyruvoyltetrahydropterin/6-carboxytetrahydropterin synthase